MSTLDILPKTMPRCETCPFHVTDPGDLTKSNSVCIYEPQKIVGVSQQGITQLYPRMSKLQTCGHHPHMNAWLVNWHNNLGLGNGGK